MGTKNNPGRFDCYDKLEPDEPYFVLMGRDPLAPGLVRQWADQAEKIQPWGKRQEARDCASNMEFFARHRAAPDNMAKAIRGHLDELRLAANYRADAKELLDKIEALLPKEDE